MADDETTIKEYQDIIRHMEDYEFYHTSVKAGREVFPEMKEGQVVVLKEYDEGIVVLQESFMEDESRLKDFLLLHMFPTVTGLSERALEKVLSGNERKGVFLFRSENDPKSKQFDEEFRKVAAAMRSKDYLFFQTDIKGSLGQQIAETFGVDESSLPILQSAELKEETMMYRHEGPITEQSIKEFIEKWEEGSMPRYYTSEPIPAENPGPVYKVVGKSFKKEVIDNTQDVLVKFYAPWCEFCKMLEPIYKKIAEATKDNKQIKFCEIDATKNDIEGYPLEGYPTIKFFPANDKDAAFTYDGDLTEEALAKFIEERTNSKLELPPDASSEDDDTETKKEDL